MEVDGLMAAVISTPTASTVSADAPAEFAAAMALVQNATGKRGAEPNAGQQTAAPEDAELHLDAESPDGSEPDLPTLAVIAPAAPAATPPAPAELSTATGDAGEVLVDAAADATPTVIAQIDAPVASDLGEPAVVGPIEPDAPVNASVTGPVPSTDGAATVDAVPDMNAGSDGDPIPASDSLPAAATPAPAAPDAPPADSGASGAAVETVPDPVTSDSGGPVSGALDRSGVDHRLVDGSAPGSGTVQATDAEATDVQATDAEATDAVATDAEATSAQETDTDSAADELPSAAPAGPSGSAGGITQPTTPSPEDQVDTGVAEPGTASIDASTTSSTDAHTAASASDSAPRIEPSTAPVQPASVTAPTPRADASIADVSPTPSTPTPEATPTQQVAEALAEVRRLADGSHRLSLQLHPEELGAVQLEVAIRDGQLHVRVVAETDAARSALEQNLPELRSDLRDAGVRAGSLEVGPDASGRDPSDPSSREPRNELRDELIDDELPTSPPEPTTASGLDIRL